MQLSGTPPVKERIAALAFILAASTTITKTGDVPMSIAVGTLISELSQYMQSCVNNGNIPFAYIHSKRIKFSLKHHIQMSFIITGSILVIMCLIKTYIFYCRYCLRLIKSRSTKKPSVMVEFIPIT